jgi:hypothetical protein
MNRLRSLYNAGKNYKFLTINLEEKNRFCYLKFLFSRHSGAGSNPSTQKTEAGGLRVEGQPGLQQ